MWQNVCEKTRYQRHLLVHEDRRTEDQKIRDLILDNCFTKKCYSFKSMENRCGRKSTKVNRCYRCTKCDAKFSGKVDFGVHMRNCFQKPFKCKKCKRSFFSMKTLETHERIHEHKRRYTCRNCAKSFSVSCLLIRHLSVVHSEKIISIDPAVNQCPMCRNIYARRRSLRIHLVSHTKQQHQCKLCGKTFPTLGKFTRHYNSCLRSKIKHECNICGKVFKCKKYVTRLMNTHREVKPHQCDICHKMFNQKRDLKNHMSQHTGEKPYQCAKCGKSFTDRFYLARHVERFEGMEPFQCDECGKRFCGRIPYKAHEVKHVGRKPITCHFCGKSFTQKSTLNVHLLIHTGEKPHHCDVCSKTFRAKSHLTRHMKTHSDNN